jgi:hypothetical protein
MIWELIIESTKAHPTKIGDSESKKLNSSIIMREPTFKIGLLPTISDTKPDVKPTKELIKSPNEYAEPRKNAPETLPTYNGIYHCRKPLIKPMKIQHTACNLKLCTDFIVSKVSSKNPLRVKL